MFSIGLQAIPQLLIIGIVGGSMIALNAIGVTLIYGTVRAINLAQGDMFALVTVFVATLVAALGISVTWPPDLMAAALVITLVAAVALGAGLSLLIEFLAFRPFRNGSRLSPLIATLGLSFILYQVSILWRQAAPALLARGGALVMGFPDIIPNTNLTPGAGFTLTPKDLMAVALAAIFALGTHLLITKTKTGKALRAVSQDADLARMFGVNVNAAIRNAFVIGGALSGAAAFIYSIYYTSSLNQQGAQSGLITFAAAILGGIGSPLGAFASGIVLGVFSSFSDYFLDARWTPVLLQFVLIALLVWRPTGLSNAAEEEGLRSRPVLSSDFKVRVSRPAGWVLAMALAAALAYPFLDKQLGWYYQPIVNHVMILGMMALGLNILVGSAGLLDLGFAVSFAIGGYAAAILSDPYGVVAKALGFTAKAAIHPRQIAAISTVMRPSEAEITEAQEALDRSIQETLRFANATSAVAYLAWLTMIPLLHWMLADVPIRRILNQRRGKMEAS
jgi:branched-subunit amino acid ABC-type transport system permease component